MQLSGTVLRAIEEVLRLAERKPADAVLRDVLRGAEFRPEQKELISRSLFTLFRWRGWLDRAKPLRGQLEHAFELADRFATDPSSFSDSELMDLAVPVWSREAMSLSPQVVREWQAPPRLWLRARPGHGAELANRLGNSEEHSTVPDAVWYRGGEDLFRTAEFHEGQFEIQDLSSQIVGHLCAPTPGQTWWDACAGEGGKTLHLCDLMNNKGLVWASDTAEWRLATFKRRAKRAKLFNYRVKPWTTKDHLPTKTKFDGVLVDAPCSGLGTWGRNPHARWSTQHSDVRELAAIQSTILGKVAGSLKVGGLLIYSVCTLTHAETEDIVNKFEAEHPEFEPIQLKPPGLAEASSRLTLWPHDWHATGMFVTGWKRVR